MKKRAKTSLNMPRHPRMVSRGDAFTIIHIGRRRQFVGDLYAQLLGAPWRVMIPAMVGVYFLLNIVFALAYLAIGDGIDHANNGSFADAFFFSVQTFASIGYGAMTPHGLAANMLMTAESVCSFSFYAVVTGLLFSKFSRPTSRIVFSDKAIITTHDGKPHFMLRLANERDNRIVDATAKLTLMRDEVTVEGKRMRRFHDLPLVRNETPILRLTWTVMHEITPQSPLYGMTDTRLSETESEIIISLTGIDETLSQTVHARHSYIADEIVCGAVFEDILHRRDDYVMEVRYDRFHQITLQE